MTHGIWTALQADAAQQVVSTTAATIGLADLQSVYTTLPDRLVTRPVATDDYSPYLSTTTAKDARIILGDFSAYYIIRRVGMTVSYVPHLFGTTNGRPLGANGWYCHVRTGAEPVSNKAFVELVDKTSA